MPKPFLIVRIECNVPLSESDHDSEYHKRLSYMRSHPPEIFQSGTCINVVCRANSSARITTVGGPRCSSQRGRVQWFFVPCLAASRSSNFNGSDSDIDICHVNCKKEIASTQQQQGGKLASITKENIQQIIIHLGIFFHPGDRI